MILKETTNMEYTGEIIQTIPGEWVTFKFGWSFMDNEIKKTQLHLKCNAQVKHHHCVFKLHMNAEQLPLLNVLDCLSTNKYILSNVQFY